MADVYRFRIVADILLATNSAPAKCAEELVERVRREFARKEDMEHIDRIFEVSDVRAREYEPPSETPMTTEDEDYFWHCDVCGQTRGASGCGCDE